ncbi:hypothetical protein CKAH01_18580, partial [Colletotrichum kahawae]
DQLTSRHSIVAVHGLNPFGRKNHSLRAWSNGEHVWLRDAFPSKEPKARVMLYEYNANLMFRSSVAGVYEWADKLLGVLGIERQNDPKRPLIFICYQLGGIIVKAIVDKGSAVLGLASQREEAFPMATNHADICKFTGPEDRNYKFVASQISALCQEAKYHVMERNTDDTMLDNLSNLDLSRQPVASLAVNRAICTTPQPPSALDVHVAIICALKVEADAVLDVFDKFWDDCDEGDGIVKGHSDSNSYTVGRIGQHNVVVAHMPQYSKGTSSSVATNLRITFPAVRVAMVVGVCGGVPSAGDGEDIFLGDVIISTDVVEFDHGRQLPNEFRPMNSLGSGHGPKLQGFLKQIQSSWSKHKLARDTAKFLAAPSLIPGRIAPTFPGLQKDKLYTAEHRHKHYQRGHCKICDQTQGEYGATCEESEKLDCELLGCHDIISRERAKLFADVTSTVHHEIGQSVECTDIPMPRIHFGAVASGDQVLKSGKHRESNVTRLDVIGFEMEAAGVCRVMPCFVIKGVSDYADSHKNKGWQDYASRTAASCMKACLRLWRPAFSSAPR